VPLSSTELIRLSDLNFAECLREHARWTAQGVIDERNETLRTMSVTRFPAGMFNAVFPLYDTPRDAQAWLAQQLELYASAQRGCSLYTRAGVDASLAQACLDRGLEAAGATPGMACDGPLEEPTPDPRLTLEYVQSPSVLALWAEVQASSYATLKVPERVVLDAMQTPERMLGPHTVFLLGRYDGVPVAGAMALLSHGIAGLYWIGVRPEFRKRGLGEAVTRTIHNSALERGARAVVLQASMLGMPIYKALGFRQITSYPWFLAPRSRH
jgi:ribosomal protein S18 acetylase RimI-like enzyme